MLHKNLICVFICALISSVAAENTWYNDAFVSGEVEKVDELEKRIENLERDTKANGKKLDEINKTLVDLAKKLTNPNSKKQSNKKETDYNAVYDIPVSNSVVLGNPNAPITVTKFTDFQ